jgi:hypothetical protein
MTTTRIAAASRHAATFEQRRARENSAWRLSWFGVAVNMVWLVLGAVVLL